MQDSHSYQTFIQSIEQRLIIAKGLYKTAYSEYNEARKIKQSLLADKCQISAQTVAKAKSLRHNMELKARALQKIFLYFEHLLQRQKKRRNYSPSLQAVLSQGEVEKLSFVVETPLRFDKLSHKLDNLVKQYELRCSALRQEIKTTKLKLSLCEMEYKQFMASNARRISDRIQNSK